MEQRALQIVNDVVTITANCKAKDSDEKALLKEHLQSIELGIAFNGTLVSITVPTIQLPVLTRCPAQSPLLLPH